MSTSGGGFLSKLKALDAYPKINEDFFTKTMSGGIITIVASVVMVLLFLSELRRCNPYKTVNEYMIFKLHYSLVGFVQQDCT